MKKIKIEMNKPVYLGLSILEISKTLMYEFWYDYIKPKYQNDAKLCYKDTDSFIIYIKTEEVYKVLQMMLKKYLIHQIMKLIDQYKKGQNKKLIGLMKDELEGKILTKFAALRPNIYFYLMDDGNNNTKAKETRTYVIKRLLKFNDYKY